MFASALRLCAGHVPPGCPCTVRMAHERRMASHAHMPGIGSTDLAGRACGASLKGAAAAIFDRLARLGCEGAALTAAAGWAAAGRGYRAKSWSEGAGAGRSRATSIAEAVSETSVLARTERLGRCRVDVGGAGCDGCVERALSAGPSSPHPGVGDEAPFMPALVL
eukprot:365069-Chlamydomonas_euryale.AAC.31